MKILVINCGSSSIKYQLFDMEDEVAMVSGLAERIGEPQGKVTHNKFPDTKEELTIVKEEPIPLGKNEGSAPPPTKENRDEALGAARDRSTRDQSHRDQENEGEGRDWTKRDRNPHGGVCQFLIFWLPKPNEVILCSL